MARLAVFIDARDRPGMLSEITAAIHRLGGNVVTSMGYSLEGGRARLLLIVDVDREPAEVVEAVRGIVGEDARVEAAELGPDAAGLLAEFIEDKPGIVTVLESYLDPPDIMDALLRLPEHVRKRIYPMLSSSVLAYLLSEGDEDTVREILESVKIRDIVDALQWLDPDEAVDVLQKLPEQTRRAVLQLLPEELRKQLASLLRYPPETAGGIMTTSVPVVEADATVQDALQLLRKGEYDVKDVIIVVEGDGKFYGIVPVDELLRAKPETPLRRLARRPPVTVEPEEDQEEVARLMLRYEIRRLPVVDRDGRFLGVVAIEDVAYVLAEEAAEDVAKLGGVIEKPRERYLHASVMDLVKTRLPWLLLIYLIESVTASVIKGYEDVIERIAVAAAFIPLIMDTGGNIGSQASSTIVRALALGEISERNRRDVIYTVLKELATAAVVGSVLASIGFVFAYLIGHNARLALSIAATLFIVVIFADVIGASLPIIARRLGLDPAAISSPFVTTIVDVSVAIIYLNLVAKLVLGL